MNRNELRLRAGGCLVPGIVGMVLGSLVACTVTTNEDDGDSGTTAPTATEGTVLDMVPGTGFDFTSMSKITGVASSSQTGTVDRLVVPSDTPCEPPPGHGAPGQYPAACGTVWHLGGASVQQYDTFEEAYEGSKDVSITSLDKSYFFWSVTGADDLNWAVVFGNDAGEMVLFWLEGTDGDTLQFRYAAL